jgi:hypothetical protein
VYACVCVCVCGLGAAETIEEYTKGMDEDAAERDAFVERLKARDKEKATKVSACVPLRPGPLYARGGVQNLPIRA